MIIDRGASDQIVSDRSLPINIKKLVEPATVTLAGQDTSMTTTEASDMPDIADIADKGAKRGIVHNVLLLPNLRYKLLSISQSVQFKDGQAEVYINGRRFGTGYRKGGLY